MNKKLVARSTLHFSDCRKAFDTNAVVERLRKFTDFFAKSFIFSNTVLSTHVIKSLLWCDCQHRWRDSISLQCLVVLCNKYLHRDWSPRGVWWSWFAEDIYSSPDEIQQKTNSLVRTAKQKGLIINRSENKGYENKYDLTWQCCSRRSNCKHCCHIYLPRQCISQPLWLCGARFRWARERVLVRIENLA